MKDTGLEDAYNAGCQTTAQFGICNCCFPELDNAGHVPTTQMWYE